MQILMLLIFSAQAHPWCPFCNGERVRDWTRAAHADFLTSPANPFPDAPILSSRHFVAYITKGAFKPHYFLIVSKEHFDRVGDLPADYLADFEALKGRFETYYREVLRTPFVAFEHGSRAGCNAGAGKGGCIEHLHLHMLPFPAGELRDRVERAGAGELGPATPVGNLRELAGMDDYIFLQDVTGEQFAYAVTGEIPSQFMRQIVARALGVGDRWNWREAVDDGDFLLNSVRTFHALALYRELGAEAAAKLCARLLL